MARRSGGIAAHAHGVGSTDARADPAPAAASGAFLWGQSHPTRGDGVVPASVPPPQLQDPPFSHRHRSPCVGLKGKGPDPWLRRLDSGGGVARKGPDRSPIVLLCVAKKGEGSWLPEAGGRRGGGLGEAPAAALAAAARRLQRQLHAGGPRGPRRTVAVRCVSLRRGPIRLVFWSVSVCVCQCGWWPE